MSILYQWYIPERILYIRWRGVITLDHLEHTNRQTASYLAQGQPPVYIIRDDSAVSDIAPAVTMRRLVEKLPVARHPNLGLVVTVGEHSKPVVKYLTDLYFKMMRLPSHRVGTIEQALKIIQQVDPSIEVDVV